MSDDSSTPKLHIDSDWKAQAQAEKERLAQKEHEREAGRKPAGGGGPDDLPPAEFRTLVSMMASQALMALGGYGDQKSGKVIVDLPGAKLAIDLLGVLEEKTKGNLSEEESAELTEILAAVRSRFVYFVEIVARQQAGAIPGGAPGTPGLGAGPSLGAGPGLRMPS